MNNDFRKEINRESQDENIEIDFQEIYTKLLKHRQTIYTSVLICVVFSLLYSFISRPVYRATTRIMVDARPPKIVKVEEVILPDYTDRTNYYNSQIEVLKSRAVANLVSDELGNYEPWGRRGKTENKLTKITEDDRVNSLLDNIKIKPVRMTQIIEISAEDIDPNLAAKIANTWTSAYILFSSVDQLVQRKSELEADISQQMKYFKEKHPVIQGLRAEIAVIQSQINNEKDRIISPSSKVSGYNVLKNDVKITNVKVLDNAQVPKSPARPKKLINLLLALFLGLFGGVGLAFFFESLDQSIKLSSDIEGILKLSCLTIVPSYVQTEVRDEKKGEKKEEVEEEIKEEAKKEEREGEKERTVSSLISHQDRHSSVAEAFRRLRTSIIFSNPDLQKKTLLITSPSPSEGKTTIVVNLATVFAQADEKTIIVDADLRNPKLHNVFNVPRNNGLTEILAYENEDIAKFIHPTQVPNLHLLTCGAVPPNPSELLGSKKIEALIKKLAVIYDRIIFDTPPILAASDAVILSTKVDASIMVAKSGFTHKQAALRSIQFINSVGSHMLGMVLNMVHIHNQGDHYYYYYYHYGHYGKPVEKQNLKNKIISKVQKIYSKYSKKS